MTGIITTDYSVKSISGTAGNISASLTEQAVSVDLVNTAVTPGSYTSSSLALDSKGRITNCTNGGTSGNLVLIDSQTANVDTNLDFNGVFDNTYNAYAIYGYQISTIVNTFNLQCLVGTGGTPTYQTTGYLAGCSFVNNSGVAGSQNSTTYIPIAGSSSNPLFSTVNYNFEFSAIVYIPSNTNFYPNISGRSVFAYDDGAGGAILATANFGGYWTTASAWTSIRFQMSSNTILTGVFDIFGIEGI